MVYTANIFDLCPDIEGLIIEELEVLLKFREAAQELKLRIRLSEKALKKQAKRRASHSSIPRGFNSLQHVLFPYMNTQHSHTHNAAFPRDQTIDIHGIKYYSSKKLYHDTTNGPSIFSKSSFEQQTTHLKLNETLTMLGARKFKSQKKDQKIKMIIDWWSGHDY